MCAGGGIRDQTGHIPGAIGIPLKHLKRRLPRSKEIVVYCRGPNSVFAVDAVRLLRSKGRKVFRLDASVQDWRARGLPLATGPRPQSQRSVRRNL